MWVPDVYQGAPTAVTLFIGSAPNSPLSPHIRSCAGLGAEQLLVEWQQMLIVMAVLSMAIGNIAAIAQTNLNGCWPTPRSRTWGSCCSAFCPEISTAMARACSTSWFMADEPRHFGMIMVRRAAVRGRDIDDFKGLNQRSPWLAF